MQYTRLRKSGSLLRMLLDGEALPIVQMLDRRSFDNHRALSLLRPTYERSIEFWRSLSTSTGFQSQFVIPLQPILIEYLTLTLSALASKMKASLGPRRLYRHY